MATAVGGHAQWFVPLLLWSPPLWFLAQSSALRCVRSLLVRTHRAIEVRLRRFPLPEAPLAHKRLTNTRLIKGRAHNRNQPKKTSLCARSRACRFCDLWTANSRAC
jgi:hypothetical protein